MSSQSSGSEVCSKCGREYPPPTCDPCLAESLMARVRKYERIAREHQESALNPNFRKLAFDKRKDLRELGLAEYVTGAEGSA